MNEVALEVEGEALGYFGKLNVASRQSFVDAGTQFVKFSPADAKVYVDTMNNAMWDQAKETLTPEEYAEARRFLTK